MKFYGNRREITQAWDLTQERLKCCGIDSWHDWQLTGRIPESCCRETYGGQRQPCSESPSPLSLYSKGCLNTTTYFIQDHAAIIGASGIAVAILMVSWSVTLAAVRTNQWWFFSLKFRYLAWYSPVRCLIWSNETVPTNDPYCNFIVKKVIKLSLSKLPIQVSNELFLKVKVMVFEANHDYTRKIKWFFPLVTSGTLCFSLLFWKSNIFEKCIYAFVIIV